MFDIFELYDVVKDNLTCIEWLMTKSVLKSDVFCLTCGATMVLTKKERNINSFVWRCRKRTAVDAHDTERGILKDSFFEDARIPLRRLVMLIYEFGYETPVERASKKIGISLHTTIRWFKKVRRLFSKKISQSQFLFGGETSIVQIDESKFLKLKNNRGNPTGNMNLKLWAFGMYDTQYKYVFLKLVTNRKQETLFPIIRNNVLPNSEIWSDEFAPYTGGPNYPYNMPSPLALLGPYTHKVVNHSVCFKDPLTGVHTNAIEGCWSGAKKKFKSMNGTTETELQSYIDEFVCRKNFLGSEDIFISIIELIAEFVN